MEHIKNPYEPPRNFAESPPDNPEPETLRTIPTSFWSAAISGGKVGIKWSTFIVAPVMFLLFIAGIIMVAFIIYREPQRTQNDPEFWRVVYVMPLGLIGAFLVCAAWVTFFGVIAGGVGYLIKLVRHRIWNVASKEISG